MIRVFVLLLMEALQLKGKEHKLNTQTYIGPGVHDMSSLKQTTITEFIY